MFLFSPHKAHCDTHWAKNACCELASGLNIVVV